MKIYHSPPWDFYLDGVKIIAKGRTGQGQYMITLDHLNSEIYNDYQESIFKQHREKILSEVVKLRL